jgi:hypothetical protein
MDTSVSTVDAPSAMRPPPPHRAPLRFYLLARSIRLMFSALLGAVVFTLWITAVVLSPIVLFAALLPPATRLLRCYADAHRREARRLTGWPMRGVYRSSDSATVLSRAATAVRDGQNWRDAWWSLTHSILASCTAGLSVGLFAGCLFYLIYPFLYWVTPHEVFGRPFDGLVVLHSVAQSTLMMPLALVCFGLWHATVLPLARVELYLTRAFLG